MSSFITNRDIPIFVTIPVIFLASKKKFRTEWENGCQKFRSERVKQCRRDFRKGNYKGIRKRLTLIDWNDKMKKQDGNRMLEHFKRGAR